MFRVRLRACACQHASLALLTSLLILTTRMNFISFKGQQIYVQCIRFACRLASALPVHLKMLDMMILQLEGSTSLTNRSSLY